MLKRIALPFLFALTFMIPAAAHAQRRSPLADAPAIRKRVELRQTRLELGAGMASTINQTFYHGVMADVRLGFHITDWLSISGMGAFNVASLGTGFHDELKTSLMAPAMPRTPTAAAADSSINKASMVLTGQVELTPFTGKYAVFGALFAHYDFYLFGGVAGVNLAAESSGNTAPTCKDNHTNATATSQCLVSGMKVGGTFGAGFHSFFNNFLALNIEVRDLMIKDNPAGRDVNGDMFADNGDLTWTSHLMASLGLTVYFPLTANVSP
jgi:outer membrane beta-barrel protein